MFVKFEIAVIPLAEDVVEEEAPDVDGALGRVVAQHQEVRRGQRQRAERQPEQMKRNDIFYLGN